MRACGKRRPTQIDKVRVRIAREALDVVCISKGVFFLSRRMTTHAVESESGVRNRKRRIVVVNALSVPNFRPVPTVLRSFTVFYHDGPTTYFRRLELVPGCGRRVLFLHDHRAVLNCLARVSL